MWHFLLFLVVAWSAGCAQTGVCPAGEVFVDGGCIPEPCNPCSKIIPVQCRNNLNEASSQLDWELTVSHETPIKSGEPFVARLDGIAVFDQLFLDGAQAPDLIPGGVEKVNLVDLNATVHVRSGATGDDDVILKPEPIPYACDTGGNECDPDNDLPSGGNTDCQPEGILNPCGRFVRLPISTDCDLGGECAELEKTQQCSDNGFCITGDLRLELDGDFGEYTADSEENVLFGWADESTGATVEEMPSVQDPTGPIGIRLGIGPFPVALECVMRFTANSALISFPIQTP